MNILLTGAAGFIGSHTADKLLELGHSVIAVDNFCDYYNPQFKEENVAHHFTNATPHYTLIRADITDLVAMRAIFQDHSIDCIIHLAAQAGVRISIQKPLLAQKVNIEGTYNLFELAREFNIQQVIFASSSSVYGNQQKTPFSENDPVDHPISPYAATKKACELIAYTYHHLYQMNCVGLRFFTVYGERGRPDMSPYLFADAILHEKPIRKFGDGSTQRDYTYINDIVSGILACIEKPLGYEIINLGNSHTVTLNEYIETFERVIGKKAIIDQQPLQPGDVNKTFADTRKAKQLLNWQPTTSLEQGLTKFLTWFEKYRI
ncbi:MAG TPA: GDP-mannose 4,6-dehydratase [Patescibacteria group bacterium]|nr:GDP-mannose 4,6-dehydratase [Patescibacteria group bacterium]